MQYLIALILLTVTPQTPATENPRTAPGTYDILICKAACGFDSAENVLVRGALIIEAQPFQPPVTPLFKTGDPGRDAELAFLGGQWMFMGERLGGPINACFVLNLADDLIRTQKRA